MDIAVFKVSHSPNNIHATALHAISDRDATALQAKNWSA